MYCLPDAGPQPIPRPPRPLTWPYPNCTLPYLFACPPPPRRFLLLPASPHSQWTTVLDLLEWYMELRGHAFCRLDGSTQVQACVDCSLSCFVLGVGGGGRLLARQRPRRQGGGKGGVQGPFAIPP